MRRRVAMFSATVALVACGRPTIHADRVTTEPTLGPALPTSTPETTTATEAPTTEAPTTGPGTTAVVSWYGAESGTTASGEPFDPSALTFAHRTMPFGSRVTFCGPLGCVVARCTDRGPFVAGRDFDLSPAAFAAIAPLGAGVAPVTWSQHD